MAAEVQQQQPQRQQLQPEAKSTEAMSREARSILARSWRNMQQRQQRAGASFGDLPTAVQLELLQRLSALPIKGPAKKNSRAQHVRWQLIKRGINDDNYPLLKRLIQAPDGSKRGATSSSLVHSFLGMRGKKNSQAPVEDDDDLLDDTYADADIDDGNYIYQDDFNFPHEG